MSTKPSSPGRPPTKQPAGAEQRQHPRVDLLAQVEVTHGDEVHILGARNASLGGLYLEGTPAEYPDIKVGSVLHVALFSADDGTEQVQGDATVVRIDPGVGGLRPPGFGVMWRTLDPRTAERLSRFLTSVSSGKK